MAGRVHRCDVEMEVRVKGGLPLVVRADFTYGDCELQFYWTGGRGYRPVTQRVVDSIPHHEILWIENQCWEARADA